MYYQNQDHEPFMKLYFALISIYSMPFFKMHIILMQTFFLAPENDFWNGDFYIQSLDIINIH